jgi:hypothetical protein
LVAQSPGHRFAFVGGYQKDPSVEVWSWIDNSAWSYENWWTGEPNNAHNNGNEDCLTLYKSGNSANGYFNDYPCSYAASFICAK